MSHHIEQPLKCRCAVSREKDHKEKQDLGRELARAEQLQCSVASAEEEPGRKKSRSRKLRSGRQGRLKKRQVPEKKQAGRRSRKIRSSGEKPGGGV